MSNSNNEDAILQVKNMMISSGLWPKKEESYSYKFRKFVSWNLSFVEIIFLISQLIVNINFIDTVTDVLCLIATYGSFMIKFLIFQYKSKIFVVILKELQQETFTNYPNEYDHYIQKITKISTFVARLYQMSCFCVIILYALKPIFVKDGQRLPIEVPFKIISELYYVYYVFQVVSLLMTAWNNSSLDALAMGLMGIASAQLDILSEKLTNLAKLASKEKNLDSVVEMKVKNCVIHHIAIIRYVEHVENVFSYGFLTQFVDSLVVICTIGFQVAHASSLQFILMFFYFVAMIMQLSLYCWFGNDVIYKSERIKDACYDSDWYSFNSSIKKSLFIIMERSKRPLKLTAGKFSDLSLISFMGIIRSSYSYFAVMQRMYAKAQNELHHNQLL